MSDFPNKIVTLILVFVMLVLAPLTWSYVRSEMTSERLVFNEMAQFLDKVTDKAEVTQNDLDELYLAVNSTGGTYDVLVHRYVRMATKDENNQARTVYLSGWNSREDIPVSTGGQKVVKMNLGDMVKISIEEVGIPPTKRLLWSILRIDEGKTKISLTASVR